MTKYEAEDRLLAQFVALCFSQRYPDLDKDSVNAYSAAALRILDGALGQLLIARDSGAIGQFHTEFRARAL